MSLWDMTVAGGVVILAVTAARALLLHRLPKSVFPVLWMVAVLRLLVPLAVPSPVSVYALFAPGAALSSGADPASTPPPMPVAGFVAQAPEKGAPAAENTVAEGGTDEPVPAAQYVSVPWRTLFWAEGAVLVGAVFAVSYLAALARFREAVPAENSFTRRWQREHRLRRQVRLRLSGRVDAPMTYGLVRPVVLLPAHTDWRDEQRLGLILAHEYAHIRRWDALTKLALAGAACVHWFNPLVWVMFLLANRDIELACDEQVLRAMDGDGRAAYAGALIDMAAARPLRTPLASYFAKSAMEERVRAVMRRKKPGALAGAAGAALVLAVTAVFATAAPADAPAPVQPTPAPAAVLSEAPPHTVTVPLPSAAPAPTPALIPPNKGQVLAAREAALAGMSQEEIDRLTQVIVSQDQWWEREYLGDILTRLDDPDDLAWNWFDSTGWIEVSCQPSYSYWYEGELSRDEIDAVMEREGLDYQQFCEKYGETRTQTTIAAYSGYSVDEIVAMVEQLRDTVGNEDLRADLAYLADLIVLARDTHDMEYVNDIVKLLHDMDYYLLRYGPEDQPSTLPGQPSVVARYYGMLTAFGADHGGER